MRWERARKTKSLAEESLWELLPGTYEGKKHPDVYKMLLQLSIIAKETLVKKWLKEETTNCHDLPKSRTGKY